jgi:acetyl esterase/lipase
MCYFKLAEEAHDMALAASDAFPSITYIGDLQYNDVNGRTLLLDMFAPPVVSSALRPAVVWLYGGGWCSGDRTDGHTPAFCPLLAQHGFVAVSIDYRLSQEAPFPAQIHDVKAAIRWLRVNAGTYHIDPNRIGIWGFSAGAHLAALAGVTGNLAELEGNGGAPGVPSHVQAVAMGAGCADFLDFGGAIRNDSPYLVPFFGGTISERKQLAQLASPIYHIHPGMPPFLIAHGTLDETIPIAQVERFADALRAVGAAVEFTAIEGVYHNWTTQMDAPEDGDRERDLGPLALPFFQKHLLA